MRIRKQCEVWSWAVVVAVLVVPRAAAAQSAGGSEFTVLGYARVGLGAAMADGPRRAPAVGFGLRGERDDFGLDISFFNYAIDFDPYGGRDDLLVGSRLKLMALHYLTTERSRSAYVGGGLSWGSGSLSRGSEPPHSSATSWHGNGLQAELTTGYELGRGSDLRLFIQGDASLPLFMVTSTTYVPTPGVRGSSFAFAGERRYLPSAVISLGIGWARR